MSVYQKLSSEKYWEQSLAIEQRRERVAENRRATESLQLFVFTIAVMAGVAYSLQTMPQWLPHVTQWLHL